MKVHYKIALAAAVAFFIVVTAYMLTSSDGDNAAVVTQTTKTKTLQATTTANRSGNITPVPLKSGKNANNGTSQDLKSLVRDHLAAFNKPTKSVVPSTFKPVSSTPLDLTKPIVESPTPTITFDVKPNPQTSKPQPALLNNTTAFIENKPAAVVTSPVINTPTPKPQSILPPKNSYPTQYTIQSGDTLSSIALTLYGSDRYWVEIAQANPSIDPLKLKPDMVLKLPQAQDLREPRNKRSAYNRSTKSQYTVRAGDNLSTIAHEFYNNSGLWKRIYNANKSKIGSNPDTLQAGVTLDIPPVNSKSQN